MVPGEDGQEVSAPCKQQAKLYHIKATCKSVKKGEGCMKGESRRMGHDFPVERREVEERRREQGIINREQARLKGQEESIKVAAMKAAAKEAAAARE